MTVTQYTPGRRRSLATLATMSGLEFLQAIARGELRGPPIAKTLGFKLAEVEEGRAVFDDDVLDLCTVIEGFQAKAAPRTTVRSAVLLLTSSTAVRTPAGFSGRLPCFGKSITSSASPTMKFTVLSVWLLAIPNIGVSKNSSICRRMRAQRLKRKYRLDMHLIGEAGLARCSTRNSAKTSKS